MYKLIAMVFGVFILSGCNTYSTTQVRNGTVRGFPFIFAKPYVATVTYADDSTSTHMVSVPTLYAVDTERSAIGVTKVSFENNTDGFIQKSSSELDQKIPENIAAITTLLEKLGVKVAGTPSAPGAPSTTFDPPLDPAKSVKKIEFKPVER
jgi:hypothetical protein